MNTADLITSYLNNEMNPEQERQFLLSVAASDQLRLSLKSHVMLDRIIFQQSIRTGIPDGVRGTIFAEMSAALAAPIGAKIKAPRIARPSVVAKASRTVRGMLAGILLAGSFGAGYLIKSDQAHSTESRQAILSMSSESAPTAVIAFIAASAAAARATAEVAMAELPVVAGDTMKKVSPQRTIVAVRSASPRAVGSHQSVGNTVARPPSAIPVSSDIQNTPLGKSTAPVTSAGGPVQNSPLGATRKTSVLQSNGNNGPATYSVDTLNVRKSSDPPR